MFWRGAAALFAAIMLSGCETARSGLDYSGMMQKIGPPKPGQSRIVILREKGFGGLVDGGWQVQVDGQPMSGLKTGTYVYADRGTGEHQLGATEGGFPGVTRLDVATASGRTYFYVARPSARKNAFTANAGRGVLGLVVTTAITSGYNNPGPLDFLPLDDAAAKVTIAELRLAE